MAEIINILTNPARYRKFLAALLTLAAVVVSQFIDLPEGWATQTQTAAEGLLIALNPVLVWAFRNR